MKVQRGFTVIGLLIVFAAVTVLSAILFPRFCQGSGNSSSQLAQQHAPGAQGQDAVTASM